MLYNEWENGNSRNRKECLLSLRTALEFLEVVIVVYVRMGDRVDFGDKWRKFLGAVANPTSNTIAS